MLAPPDGLPAGRPICRYRHARPARRRRAGLVTLVLLLGIACLTGLLSGLTVGAPWNPMAESVAWITGADARPVLPGDASRSPLALPARAPAGSGGYAVLEHEDDGSGRPVRWDPCRPIHYVIRTDGATPAGLAAVRAAIVRVEQVTGLRFTDDGTTDEAPRADRPVMDRGRYGDRWSPVLIGWTDPEEFPSMNGYAGLGGPESVGGGSPGQRRYVTGVVLLNRSHLAEIEHWDHGPQRVEAVVRHEFAHLVGLDHVEDPAELMYPRPSGSPADYAAGDLRGLVALSAGPCFRDY